MSNSLPPRDLYENINTQPTVPFECFTTFPLQWRHNERVGSQITGVSIFCLTVCSGADQRNSQSSASLALWGNSPVTAEFLAEMASNVEHASIWWRHHEKQRNIALSSYINSYEIQLAHYNWST